MRAPCLAAFCMAAFLATDSKSATMTDDYASPPWQAAADETAVTDAKPFADCDETLAAYAARSNGVVSGRTYTRSPQWGWVLRAKLAFSDRRGPYSFFVTCWTGAPSDPTRVGLATQLETDNW